MTMKIKVRSWLAVEVAVLFGLATTANAVAQQAGVAAQRPVSTATAPAVKSAEGPGPREGITVHGHWVMNVRDAQGKVVEHRDFENSLFDHGQTVLTSLLIGAMSAGYFRIFVFPQDTSHGALGILDQFPETYFCGSDKVCSANLVVTPVTTTGVNNRVVYSGLTINGSFKAPAANTLSLVETHLYVCRAPNAGGLAPSSTRTTYAPSDCPAYVSQFNGRPAPDGSVYDFPLTGTTIPPLSIAAGQTLDITVTLSFS